MQNIRVGLEISTIRWRYGEVGAYNRVGTLFTVCRQFTASRRKFVTSCFLEVHAVMLTVPSLPPNIHTLQHC